MQSRKVVSSNLEHVAYDELNQELLVIFKSGDAYIYLGVNDLEWEQLIKASSHGTYLNSSIKPQKACRKLPEKGDAALHAFCGNAGAVAASRSKHFQLRDHLRPGIKVLNLFFA